jgi:phosphoadenosine phosphosulfate reductase
MIDLNKIKSTLKKSERLAEIYGCRLNLGFSGGKDSVVLKYFADLYGIDYIAHFNNTQIEQYNGMIRFIKTNYPDVCIVHPDKENSFFELMKSHGLPSLFRRWCCKYLKHSNPKLAEYRVNIMGVRGEESKKRMERGAISVFGKSKRAEKTREKLKATFANTDGQVGCEGGKDEVNVYPLFDLTEREIWDIIRTENLTIPDAYADSKRLGCAFCPFASFRENYETIKSRPNIVKAWLRVLSGDEFRKNRDHYKGVSGVELFYLYISGSLSTRKDFQKGFNYLKQKDLYGKTGLQRFESFLNENNIKTE